MKEDALIVTVVRSEMTSTIPQYNYNRKGTDRQSVQVQKTNVSQVDEGLVKFVSSGVVSEEVLEGTEIPAGVGKRETVTTRMTPALRWAMVRVILTFH